MVSLTIIIPLYNETNTILKIIDKISKIKISKQIIVVDDYSTDGSREKIRKLKLKNLKILFHPQNKGKGSAIKTAQKYIKGKYTLIQDADLEYDPKDYSKLLYPFKKKKTKVVYGSRVLGKKRYNSKKYTSLVRVFFNHVLTIISNIINNQKLTDAHTCYKVFESTIFKKIILKEKGFAFCPEVTTKISNLKLSILEVPISYKGRTFQQGKKISYTDGFRAIYALLKYKFIK